MGWDFNEGQDKTNFTKFSVGITRIRILDEEPMVRWIHWMGQYQKSVNCPGRGCPIDEIRKQQKANGEDYTYNMGRRFTINVYNHDTNRAEIMEQGITFFEDLRDVMTDLTDQGKKLKDVILKVRRRGSTKDDTSYRIDIDVEEPLSVPEIDAYDNLVDMKEYFKPHNPAQILKLLQVRAETPEKYKEAWNEIMKAEEPASHESDNVDLPEEDIEVR